ncbi:M14 family metallopeptidase [Intestinibacter sp.]|uniref:M14 family metallopeptidase n=1 Tax=Intestinibacter sp. TaxID=1965304 RepID=UPI003F149CD4
MSKVVESISSFELPIDEKLEIKRCRFLPDDIDQDEIKKLKRISIVTGTHGDELEGQLICFNLSKTIEKNINYLNGIVDIYPALNPLGIDSITRGIPDFDLDMNRLFPGNSEKSMIEANAHNIIEALEGSDMVIDLHASNIFLKEIPQARINKDMARYLLPYAKKLNLDFIWIHESATVLESTLCHSLNILKTPCIVVELGVGMRLTQTYCNQTTKGILNLMKEMGIWNDKRQYYIKEPIISTNKDVSFCNAGASGIFVPCINHDRIVKCGQKIGEIVDPLEAVVKDEVISPCDGLVFTLREYPVVYEGSLIARILEEVI